MLSTLVLSNVATPLLAFAETVNESNTTVNKEKDQDFSSRATIVQTGKWGTSPMTLDSDGVLVVKSGTIKNVTGIYVDTDYKSIIKDDVKKIIFEGKVTFPSDSSSMFALKQYKNLISIDFTGADMSGVTTASSFFYESSINELIGFEDLDFPKLVSSKFMFSQAKGLTNIGLKWTTPDLNAMNSMFSNTAVKKVDLSHLNTSKVENMSTMFSESKELEELDMSSFDMSSVVDTGCQGMFYLNSKLKKLTLGPKVDFKYNASTNNPKLPTVRTSDTYTGRWINVDNPSKVFNSSEDFMKNYNGAKDAGTYVWEEKIGQVTVNYIDESGTALASSDTLIGLKIDEAYTTTPKVIPGYQVKEIQGNADGVFTRTDQTVSYVYERIAGAPVTVNYKDTEGALLDSETLNGLWGDAWTASSKNIPGYEVIDTPEKETGVFGDNPQTLDYVYKKLLPGEVLVEYLDEDGNAITDAKVLTGLHGTAYETSAPTIEGFELKTTPNNANGTFDQDKSQKVTYVYTRLDGAPVTVTYEDEAGKELAKSDTLNGKFGTIFETNPKAIEGYRLTKTPENQSGEFTMNPQTVTYTYTAQEAGTITVNYVDQDGGLLDSVTLDGTFDETYNTDEKAFTGYEFTGLGKDSAPVSGKFTMSPQTITYQYQAKEAAPITVKYVDTAGNELASDTLTGLFGTSYTTEAKEFSGYTLKTTPNNANGTFSMDAQTVTYVYEAGRGEAITVKYINQEGNEIAASKILNGKVGQSFNETAKKTSGYDLIGDEVRTFTITDEPQTVVFEYVGKAASKLTIQYVDEATGEQIAPATGITGGKTGDAYNAEVKVIPGYTVVDDSKANGFRPQSATTYQITYKKNEAISFDLNYVGVNQQKVIGFLPTGVTTSQLNLYVKKAGENEWKDSGYTGTADEETGYFAIESRLVKGGQGFLLENQDQVKVVFTGNDGNTYEGVKVVQPYTAPEVNEYTAGEEFATGNVPNGANYVRLAINNVLTRTVATTPTPGASLPGSIDAKTGDFKVYAKNYSDTGKVENPGNKIIDTKAGDTLTLDYGVQIYGAQNNPSTTIIAK